MRFDTPIYFQRVIEEGSYNPETGNQDEDTVTEEGVYADVTESRTETLNLVYGEIKQGCLTVRLQNIYRKPFSRIRIGDKLYRVDYSRKLRTKQIFVVSEVQ
jgi:hypothetical protein